MKRSLVFAFFLDMWAYIQKHKLSKIAKWTKTGIKEYTLEWNDELPEPPPPKRRKVVQ